MLRLMKRTVLCLVTVGLLMVAGCAEERRDSRLGVGNYVACEPETFKSRGLEVPKLQPAGSCAKLAGYLTEYLIPLAPGGWDGPCFMCQQPVYESSPDEMSSGPGSTLDDYTGTNVQEAGVDELDLMKTDGRYIYLISGGELLVYRSWPPEDLALVGRLALEGFPFGLFVDGDMAVILGTPDFEDPAQTDDLSAHDLRRGELIVQQVDLAQPAEPVAGRKFELNLRYIASRMVDGRVYIVGDAPFGPPRPKIDRPSSMPFVDDDRRERAQEALAKTRYEEWIPTWYEESVGTRLFIDSFSDLYIPTAVGGHSFQGVFTIDISDREAEPETVGFLAGASEVYASPLGLHLVYNTRSWRWMGGESAVQSFTIEGGVKPEYRGAGKFPGFIQSPFWMSEHDGHLRVVSTIGPKHYLTVLGLDDGGWRTVGQVTGFAPQETIFSSRFVGDLAFVSTYFVEQRKDPLFTIDLSNPRKPLLLGALDMPGYTNYLHLLDENRLLGIGMFAEDMGAPVTAVQAQVFDISDFSNPVTESQVVWKGAGRTTLESALADHHGFNLLQPENLFMFPLGAEVDSDLRGMAVMRVDDQAGLVQVGRISHGSRTIIPNRGYFARDEAGGVFIYAMSERRISVHAPSNVTGEVSSIELP